MFSLDSIAKPIDPGLQTLEIAPARDVRRSIEARRFVSVSRRAKAIEQLRPLPSPGEVVHGTIDGSYSGWSLFEAIVEILGEPADVVISTLGFNRENCRSLLELIDSGHVRSVLMNVSHYFKHSDRDIFADIERELANRGQRIAITRSHAKLLLFKTPTRNIVVETSANFRSSKNWEQFVVSDCAELLAFHRGWIDQLIARQPKRLVLERRR